MQVIEVTKELSEMKSNGLQIVLGELMTSLDQIERIRALRRSREEHKALSLTLLQGAFAMSRIAILATLYQACAKDSKLNSRTWAQIHFN